MESQDNNKIGDSMGNSLSSGDPNLKTNQGETSTESTSSENSGESAPQSGENIVNKQEQNKSVNMEEFVENSAQNRFDDNEKSFNNGANNFSPEEVTETGDNLNDTNEKMPTMTSGAL